MTYIIITQGSLINDLLVTCCCNCCSIIQVSRVCTALPHLIQYYTMRILPIGGLNAIYCKIYLST